MRELKHPRAVAIYDFGGSNSIGYIEMEYVRGRTLDEILEEHQGQPMPLEWIVPILDQLCAVLQEAHGHVDEKTGKPKPIIHRDLKLSNLMLVDQKRDGQDLKVLDFGIAKILNEAHERDQNPLLTIPGEFVGTVGYCSPEQIKSTDQETAPELDGRSDIYSVGVLLYQLLSGLLPFRFNNKIAVLSAHLMTVPEPPSKANPKVDHSPRNRAAGLAVSGERPGQASPDRPGAGRTIPRSGCPCPASEKPAPYPGPDGPGSLWHRRCGVRHR